MKSDTKIANSKITVIYNFGFFSILPADDAFIENITSKTYTQLIICISKRMLFLFIFVWLVVDWVRHSELLWPPGWPWLMPKMPLPCLIFDIYLFALWMNMQSWKDLLVLVYPHYRGLFILLDCGWSGGCPSRPMSRHRLATLPLARVHSFLSGKQCPDTTWQPSVQRSLAWSHTGITAANWA